MLKNIHPVIVAVGVIKVIVNTMLVNVFSPTTRIVKCGDQVRDKKICNGSVVEVSWMWQLT